MFWSLLWVMTLSLLRGFIEVENIEIVTKVAYKGKIFASLFTAPIWLALFSASVFFWIKEGLK